ncbi:MAG: hypothetical protein II375_01285 [Bacteroidales bacterium]|nr:hypothetical protein [Bacteroidales bacterium]
MKKLGMHTLGSRAVATMLGVAHDAMLINNQQIEKLFLGSVVARAATFGCMGGCICGAVE